MPERAHSRIINHGNGTFEYSFYGYHFPDGWKPKNLHDKIILRIVQSPLPIPKKLRDWAFEKLE